jgi:Cu+-exporting ATPase
MALEVNPAHRSAHKTIYTCPMHPQIERDHPGQCPICGMTLEPKAGGEGQEEENAELKSMTRRFWIGLALTGICPRSARFHPFIGQDTCRMD